MSFRNSTVWLETRTLCPKPRDLVRRIPQCLERGKKKDCWLASVRANRRVFQASTQAPSWEELR